MKDSKAPGSAGGTDSTRTRFAPSPTGNLHLGGARTALFNYFLAKQKGGSFLIRIEDTDLERSKEPFVNSILADLEWLGVQADEGPVNGGAFGPYRQSQKLTRYLERLETLKNKNLIYPCFCTRERLANLKKSQESRKLPPRYDGHCDQLPKEEIQKRLAEQAPHAWRLRISSSPHREIAFQDLIHGAMSFKARDLEDFIISREDGTPPFLFSSIIDDIDMKVSVVLRGDDHLSNTPKQILIAAALGDNAPQYGHLPLVLSQDGTPLSKRLGDWGIAVLREKGFLPQAITQGILLLGWSPPAGFDIHRALSLQEQTQVFSIERIGKSSARVDLDKLRALNRLHLRQMPAAELLSSLRKFCTEFSTDLNRLILDEAAQNPVRTLAILEVIQGEGDTLPDLVTEFLGIARGPDPAWTEAACLNMLKEPAAAESLKEIETFLGKHESLEALPKNLYKPLRLSLSGRQSGPKLVDLFRILGKDEVGRRLSNRLIF